MRKKDYTANDMRSRHMNRQDEWGQTALDNHANQLNPNNDRYEGDRDDYNSNREEVNRSEGGDK